MRDQTVQVSERLPKPFLQVLKLPDARLAIRQQPIDPAQHERPTHDTLSSLSLDLGGLLVGEDRGHATRVGEEKAKDQL